MIATKKLHLDGLPYQLKIGIDAGAELTVHEWAEEFSTTDKQIRSALSALRQKHGFHQYHPIGTKVGKGFKQGVILDITKKAEWLSETIAKQKTNYVDPQLLAFAKWFEDGYRKFPALRQHFKSYLSEEISKLVILDEELKNPNANR